MSRIKLSLAAVTMLAGFSQAAQYQFASDQSVYTTSPGQPVTVTIRLLHSPGGTSPALADEDGLYGFGFKVSTTSGDAGLASFTILPAGFTANSGTPVYATDSASLSADRSTAPVLAGPTDADLPLASLVITPTTSSTFSIGDFGSSDDVITYGFNVLDAGITPGSFTIVVPEPTTGLALVSLATLLRRRRA